MKINGTAEEYSPVYLIVLDEVGIGDTMSSTIQVLNDSSYSVTFRFVEVGTSEYSDVTIPSSSSVQDISLSRIKTTDANNVQLLLILRNSLTMYLDNCHLTIQ